jgi:type IV pilus biogenesis protein CpaD/CtpE
MTSNEAMSVGAIRSRQSALATQHGAAADADRVLADVLASAHAATRESVRRLDAIAEELDRAATGRSELAVDTPIGAREFRKFLVAKQREIAAIVADARDLSRAKRAVLDGLRAQYAPPAG